MALLVCLCDHSDPDHLNNHIINNKTNDLLIVIATGWHLSYKVLFIYYIFNKSIMYMFVFLFYIYKLF